MRAAPMQPRPARDQVTDPFQRLPYPVPSLLVHYLDSRSCKHLACAVPTDAVFRQALRVSIPPDKARRNPLIEQLTASASASTDSQLLRLAIVDHGLLTSLSPIADQVEDIKFTRTKFRWLPRHSMHTAMWTQLQVFRRLVRLKIQASHFADVVDLDALSRCLPQLQKLSIRDCEHVINKLQPLSDLHTLKLVATNINSFAIAEGMPKLTSLTMLLLSDDHFLDHDSLRKLLYPLRTLRVYGCWFGGGTLLDRYRLTIEKFNLMDMDDPPRCRLIHSLREGITYPVLRSLYVGQWENIDLEPLAVLVALEELGLTMHQEATHCRPLQRLKKLRKLSITRGSLRDIIGCIPSLERFICHDFAPTGEDPHPRAVFTIPRRSRYCGRSECNIHTLLIRGAFDVGLSERVVSLLHRVEQVEIDTFKNPAPLIAMLSRLPRLRRVFIRHGSDDFGAPLGAPFASVHCLEELFASGWDAPRTMRWLAKASRLRKLALRWETTPIASCPLNLTHLYLPDARDLSLVLEIRRFKNLRVVAIPMEADCLVLRRERHEGGELPLL